MPKKRPPKYNYTYTNRSPKSSINWQKVGQSIANSFVDIWNTFFPTKAILRSSNQSESNQSGTPNPVVTYLIIGFIGALLGSLLGQGVGLLFGADLSNYKQRSDWSGGFGVPGVFVAWVVFSYFKLKSPIRQNAQEINSGNFKRVVTAYAKAGRRNELEQYLRKTLPNWNISQILIEAVSEVLLLKKNALIATKAGIPTSYINPLLEETDPVLAALWQKADRLQTIASYQITTPELEAKLEVQAEQIKKIANAARASRSCLAELTLDAGELSSSHSSSSVLEKSALRLRTFVEAAREINSW